MLLGTSFCTSAKLPAKKFGVLVAGHANEYTLKKYGGYGPMLVNLLKDPGESWKIFHVVDGVFPEEDELGEYNGFVVSGSRHDAHGDEPWIKRLCQTLMTVHRERKKILGICFGHQVVTRALGGFTGRAPVGWEVGLREVEMNENMSSKPYGKGVPGKLKLYQSHRDQVLELPPGGLILGSSERTRVEALAVENHVLGIQGHPEFTKDVMLDIIETRLATKTLSVVEAMEAQQSVVDNEDDKHHVQNLCKRFLKY